MKSKLNKIFIKDKFLFIFNIIFLLLESLTDIYIAIILKRILDYATNKNIHELVNEIKFSLVFVLVAFLTGLLRRNFKNIYTKKVITTIKKEVFCNLLEKNFKSFFKEDTSEYISILNNDVLILEQDYINNIFDIIYKCICFILATIVLIKINIYIAIVIYITSIFPLITPFIFSEILSKNKEKYSQDSSFFTKKIKDFFQGFEVIKTFNIEEKIRGEFNGAVTKMEHAKYRANTLVDFTEVLAQNLGFMIYFCMYIVCAYLLIDSKITYGSLIAIIQLSGYIVTPVVSMSSKLSRVKSAKKIKDKIDDLLIEKGDDALLICKKSFQNSIELIDVKFSYSNKGNIIDGISLSFKKGKKYAIVGKSGCGKSTLLKLIQGCYNDYEGLIKIDGIEISQLSSESLATISSTIHQNTFLFNDSIQNNIDLNSTYSEDEINPIIKSVGLSELVNKLDGGADFFGGENGRYLSGGEKQRIAIARALINKTPILMCDEGTASLDNQTSSNIENLIINQTDLTCIVVTHKLIKNILIKYDSIIVMKNNKVEEIGSFEELIKRKGYFYSLYILEN